MTDVAVDLGCLAGRTFAGVLFDMDGTLIDSTASVERCWATWAGEFDVALADLQGWHGVPALGVITHFVAPEFVEAADRRLRELEIGDARDIPMLAGGAESLAALANSGRVGIATSCTDDLALARFAASGLIPPPVVVTASQVAHGKPHPDPYLEAARRLGLDPADCLVVEDAPAGLASAKAAGCATLAVVTTTGRDALVATGNADAVVPDLASVRFVVDDSGIRLLPAVD